MATQPKPFPHALLDGRKRHPRDRCWVCGRNRSLRYLGPDGLCLNQRACAKAENAALAAEEAAYHAKLNAKA